jgi:DNA-binding NtrC family response regulator
MNEPSADSELAGLSVAIVDDDPVARRMGRAFVERAGGRALEFSSGRALLDDPLAPAFVLLDLGLGDMSGTDVLQHLRARDPDVVVLVVTSRRDVDTAVQCMRLGAFDFLPKPVDPARLVESLRAAVAQRETAEQVRRRREGAVCSDVLVAGIIGRSTAIREAVQQVERVLDSDVTVCLFGESGVGKEVFAQAIHSAGRRRRGPFVAVNCAAIPASVQESELFGHEKGSFTGAVATRKGRFEQAHGGTLFLDELGEMAPATQAALLRTIQEKSIRRVGGNTDIPINVRIVCATHRDLEAEVEEGRFRRDLYFRLVVFPVEIPPLRQRRDDIPLLVGAFLKKLAPDVGREVTRVSPDALDALARYPWPGNVRELQNVVHRAMLSCPGAEISLAHLPPTLQRAALPEIPAAPVVTAPVVAGTTTSEPDVVVSLAEVEKRAILHALKVAGGSVSKAARLLGIGRTTLYRRLAELGLPPESA